MQERITIRRANARDSKGFLSLLKALADFEHLEPPDAAASQRILNDVFQKKIVNLFVASENWRLVGYALYFFTYSSFLARPTLYLEDIFVLEDSRGHGIGKGLFMHCAKEARKKKCGRMEWSVLTWNKNAIDFYEMLGARRLEEWYYYRLDSRSIDALATKIGVS